jgi:hypothetical protein
MAMPPEEETIEVDDLVDMPYEDEEADQVPEYGATFETGILQPDESPDWMLALTGQLSPDMVDAFETEPVQAEDVRGEHESLLSVLGLEMDASLSDEQSSIDGLPDMEVDQTEAEKRLDEELFDLDQLAPPAEEEGAMPDWLAAITGTAQQDVGIEFGADVDFGDNEAYNESAETSGEFQPDGELDWLAPMTII